MFSFSVVGNMDLRPERLISNAIHLLPIETSPITGLRMYFCFALLFFFAVCRVITRCLFLNYVVFARVKAFTCAYSVCFFPVY